MNEYPLHWYVYENDVESLKKCLNTTPKNEIDKPDLRNKTALELAVFLNHLECAKVLVEHGADCCHITKAGWNLVQESVSTGNADLIRLIMTYRDYQRTTTRNSGIPELLNKLKQAPDFYVEMKWEFTSWIPLISKACPSDVYRIYKSGSNVRIDTTLIGFNGSGWERGNRSYIFQAAAPPPNSNSDSNTTSNTNASNQSSPNLATIIEIDHLKKTYYMDKLSTVMDDGDEDDCDLYEPSPQAIQNKLLSPNIVTYLDIEKIEFERNKSGFFGWRTEKTESINGYNCKVYTANNLQLITKTRVEHLNSERAQEFLKELDEDSENEARQAQGGALPGFLSNIFQGSQKHIKVEKSNKTMTALEYFQKHANVDYYLNGTVKSIDETQKMQSFNATLSLCDSYPLLLHEQVSPIVDLMALNNSHFKKLKEFITLQLPSGFPVKIEIPLYRVITAKVTFGNINALDHPVENVSTVTSSSSPNRRIPRDQSFDRKESQSAAATLLQSKSGSETSLLSAQSAETGAAAAINSTCVVDESVFKIPPNYRCLNYYSDSTIMPTPVAAAASSRPAAATPYYHHHRPTTNIDEDDILLQLAIQQSLSEGNEANLTDEDRENVTALEALTGSRQGGTQSLSDYQRRLNSLNSAGGGVRRTAYEDEELILQRVLAESLLSSQGSGGGGGGESDTTSSSLPQIQLPLPLMDAAAAGGDDLSRILELSKREEEERRKREADEEEELKRVLELSLMEK